MDITSLSTAMSSAKVINDVQTAMLSKSIDTLNEYGDGMKKVLEASVTPHIGQNIDYTV